jgi:hypothetical protein
MFLVRAFATTLLFCVSAIGYGERGELPSARALSTPVSGFPGVFDSFMPGKKSFVVSGTAFVTPLFPLVGVPVEYGLTENVSIGTNAALPLLWAQSSPAFGGKVRVRIPLTSSFVTAFSAYGYMLPPSQKEEELEGETQSDSENEESLRSGTLFTATASYFFSERLWINASLSRFDFSSRSGSEGSAQYSTAAMTSSFYAVGGEYMLARWFGFRAGVFVPFDFEITSDGGSASGVSGGTISLRSGKSGNQFSMWSFMLDFLPGERWMISPGLIASDVDDFSGYSFDVSYRW